MATVGLKTYDTIKGRIMSGYYRPSQNLTEESLSQDLGVSRTTVKKALMLLEKENLVTIETNKGAKVKAFSPEEVNNLLDVRIVLERYVINNVVERITNQDIELLESKLKKMKNLIQEKKLIEYSSMNQEFHKIIYNACSNRSAVEIILSIKNQISRYDLKTILLPNRDLESLSEHTSLVAAIKKRDHVEAERIITLHVSNIQANIKKYSPFFFI